MLSPTNPSLRQEVIAIYKGASASLLAVLLSAPQQPPFLEAHRPQQRSQLTGTCAPELLYLGKDYPQGYTYFRPRLHKAFMANAGLRDEEAIRKGIERAKFVQKGAPIPV